MNADSSVPDEDIDAILLKATIINDTQAGEEASQAGGVVVAEDTGGKGGPTEEAEEEAVADELLNWKVADARHFNAD
jgi:hypothetical protein